MDFKRGIARVPAWQSVGIKRNIGRQIMTAYEVIPAHELELLTIKWHVLEWTEKGYIEQPGDYYAQPVIGFWIVGDEPGTRSAPIRSSPALGLSVWAPPMRCGGSAARRSTQTKAPTTPHLNGSPPSRSDFRSYM